MSTCSRQPSIEERINQSKSIAELEELTAEIKVGSVAETNLLSRMLDLAESPKDLHKVLRYSWLNKRVSRKAEEILSSHRLASLAF